MTKVRRSCKLSRAFCLQTAFSRSAVRAAATSGPPCPLRRLSDYSSTSARAPGWRSSFLEIHPAFKIIVYVKPQLNTTPPHFYGLNNYSAAADYGKLLHGNYSTALHVKHARGAIFVTGMYVVIAGVVVVKSVFLKVAWKSNLDEPP